MRRFAALAAAFVAASCSVLFGAAVASAGTVVTMGGGSGIMIPLSASTGDACTLTTIGHSEGRLIGLTAAHCFTPGKSANVYSETQPRAGVLGHATYINRGLDYAVIQFDPNKVRPSATVGGVVIAGVSTAPLAFPDVACKTGRTTGTTCGVVWNSDGTIHTTQVCTAKGDSGAPIVVGDKLVGMVHGVYRIAGQYVPCVAPEAGPNIGPILNDMNRNGDPHFAPA